MAHATLEIVESENENFLYLFRMTRSDKTGLTQSLMAFDKAEAKSTSSALGAIVDRLTRQLDALAKRHRAISMQAPVTTAAAPACP